MNLQKLGALPPPPGVIGSLRAGFEAVSSHVVLILFPLALDLWLWLGPRFSVDRLLGPYLRLLFNQERSMASPADVQALFVDALERFNLLSLLGKLLVFPIGVSSLVAGTMPVVTPYGEQKVIQISSWPALIVLAFVLVVLGWVGGGLYFRWVSGTALKGEKADISSIRAIAQTFILSVIWFIGLLMMMVPIFFVLAILLSISPVLANGVAFVMLMLSFWLIVPLFFTPHGIFVRRQNALYSILSSLRMTRFTLPTSGMFVLSAIVLHLGLNYLWSVPSGDSWMMLVGIAGHAFITTALLAASFVYYRDMSAWLQTFFERVKQKQSVPGRQV